MQGQLEIDELWSLRINPSDLYNIERSLSDKPATGGGHLYIQVPQGLVDPLLTFLGEDYPPNGTPLLLGVTNRAQPGSAPEKIEFWAKSAGRMRIARQNRHRHSRLRAWSPAMGFPSLESGQGTAQAKVLLNQIGGLHIYLARADDGTVWAGYTTGEPSNAEAKLPFAKLLWGTGKGGYWRYEKPTK